MILKKEYLLFFTALWISLSCQSQNNYIFSGGIADGFTEEVYVLIDNNLIFAGGSADGFDATSFVTVGNNLIFAGGSADGFDAALFVTVGNNLIFAGGNADGFDATSFVTDDNNLIFAGGSADGYDDALFAIEENNLIFAGGNADGYDDALYTTVDNSAIFSGGFSDGFDFFHRLHDGTIPKLPSLIENADLVIAETGKGILLTNNLGNQYILQVDNAGNLTATLDNTLEASTELLDSELALKTASKGTILRSINGNYHLLNIDNSGALITTPIAMIPIINTAVESGYFKLGDTGAGITFKNTLNECWRILINAGGDLIVVPADCP